jgi:hypothetical protein
MCLYIFWEVGEYMGVSRKIVIRYSIIMILIAFTGMVISGCGRGAVEKCVVVKRVVDGNDVWEERVTFPAGTKALYKNGEKERDIFGLPIKDAKEVIKLPEIATNEAGVDIEKEEPVQAITWKSDLKKSALYLKYLQDNGFKQLRRIETPEYIEVYLEKDGVTKRVVVFNDVIMIGNLAVNKLEEIKW